MSDRVSIKRSPFMEPYAYICPLCAALLLDEEGVEKHAAWHEKMCPPKEVPRYMDDMPITGTVNFCDGASLYATTHPVGAPVAEDAEPAPELAEDVVVDLSDTDQ